MSNPEDNFINQLVIVFYKHQLKIKTFHFQTKLYYRHKAADSYLTEFLKQFDKFTEIAIGYGIHKLSLQKIDIQCDTLTDENIINDLSSFTDKIINDFYPKIKSYPDLVNIITDMIANINQFKYLLNFK